MRPFFLFIRTIARDEVIVRELMKYSKERHEDTPVNNSSFLLSLNN